MAETTLTAPAAERDAGASQSLIETMPRGQLVTIIISLMLGMLLASLDQTVVGTAMPRIITQLGGANYTWVITSYLLASTVMVPVIGKLSDIYGRKWFFISGMVIFLAGSALCGTSQDMTQLVIYRGIQGLGAGALMPLALAYIGDIFPPAERGKWQGLFTAVFGLSSIVGPLLGGAITDNWGWRWVFYVNMPVGAVALVVAALALPSATRRMRHKVDYLGSVTLIIWAVSLLLGFSLGGSELAWDSWQIITMFVVAAVGIVVFLFVEAHAAEPIIQPALFKNDIFSISTLSMFLVAAGMFGAITYLAPFVQIILGQSATNSGVILMPMMLGFIVSSIVGGQILSRSGRYKILAIVGFVVGSFGMFLLSRMTPSTSNPELVRNMVTTGLGMGLLMSLFTIIVQNAFSRDMIGQVTSSLTFFRSLGSSIGVAVLGAIVTNDFSSQVKNSVPAALAPYVDVSKLTNESTAGKAINIPSAIMHLGPQQFQALALQLASGVKDAFASSVTLAFTIGAGMMVAALIATLFLREIPLQGRRSPASLEDAANDISEAAPEPVPELML
ncbi:MAG TPA: MDR family MFS transporter [Ktedonobacterales bacterium]